MVIFATPWAGHSIQALVSVLLNINRLATISTTNMELSFEKLGTMVAKPCSRAFHDAKGPIRSSVERALVQSKLRVSRDVLLVEFHGKLVERLTLGSVSLALGVTAQHTTIPMKVRYTQVLNAETVLNHQSGVSDIVGGCWGHTLLAVHAFEPAVVRALVL